MDPILDQFRTKGVRSIVFVGTDPKYIPLDAPEREALVQYHPGQEDLIETKVINDEYLEIEPTVDSFPDPDVRAFIKSLQFVPNPLRHSMDTPSLRLCGMTMKDRILPTTNWCLMHAVMELVSYNGTPSIDLLLAWQHEDNSGKVYREVVTSCWKY